MRMHKLCVGSLKVVTIFEWFWRIRGLLYCFYDNDHVLGLRFVYPYAFTFTAHIKKRWLGLQVLELFQREFHMESVQYYVSVTQPFKKFAAELH